MSQAGSLSDNVTPGGDIETITGNTGGAVGPDGAQNVFFTASGGFSVTGNPGANTLNMAPAAWTTGSIVFADSSTSFAQDNTEFFWDSVNNRLGVGTNSFLTSKVNINAIGAYDEGMTLFSQISGTTDDVIGANILSSLTPDNNTHDAIAIYNQLTADISNDAQDIYGYKARIFVEAGGATNLYNIHIQAANNSGGGSVGNAYGLYIEPETLGVNNFGAYIGGDVSIGSTSFVSSALLTLTSTTKGFRLPVMTTAEKNAIVGPVAGLEVYDSDIAEVQFYNGAIWVGISSIVASVTGTANQITASPTTGAVILSLPSAIITPGTLAINGMTQGSVLFSGASSVVSQDNANFFWDDTSNYLGIGTAAPASRLEILDANTPVDSGVGPGMLYVGASGNKAINAGGTLYLGGSNATASFFKIAYASVCGRAENATDGNNAGYLQFNTNTAGGTVAERIRITSAGLVGINQTVPLSQLAVTGNLSIGATYGAIGAPTSGAIIEGRVGIGTAVPSSESAVDIINNTDNSALMYARGTIADADGSGNSYGLVVFPSFVLNASTSLASTCYLNPTIDAGVANTLSSSYPLYISPTYSSNTGTIGDATHCVIGAGSAGAGTITLARALLVGMPTAGTTNLCASFQGAISVGSSYSAIVPPSEGMIVEGDVGIGISAPNYQVHVASADAEIIAHQASNASATNAPSFLAMHTRGTVGSETATQSGDLLGSYSFGGFGSADVTSAAVILAGATETWSGSQNGTALEMYVTNNGSTGNALALRLSSEGSVICGGNDGAALATTATDGFLYIPSCPGAPTGTPTTATGRVAMVYDTTNNALYVYNGAWRSTTLA